MRVLTKQHVWKSVTTVCETLRHMLNPVLPAVISTVTMKAQSYPYCSQSSMAFKTTVHNWNNSTSWSELSLRLCFRWTDVLLPRYKLLVMNYVYIYNIKYIIHIKLLICVCINNLPYKSNLPLQITRIPVSQVCLMQDWHIIKLVVIGLGSDTQSAETVL